MTSTVRIAWFLGVVATLGWALVLFAARFGAPPSTARRRSPRCCCLQ